MISNILAFTLLISKHYDIPPEILPAIIRVESSYNQDAVSHLGAVGLMQVMPGAYEDYKRLNPNGKVSNYTQIIICWKANINVGAWYLKRVCYKNKGNWKDAITAYFWGAWQLPEKVTDNYYLKVKKVKEEIK